MRRDEPNGSNGHERPHDALRADAPIVGIGPVQDLVEKEQNRLRSFRQLDDAPDAENFSIEARMPLLE